MCFLADCSFLIALVSLIISPHSPTELRFPLDLACAERDHSFLEPESLQALYRRLRVLNRCARVRLDHQTSHVSHTTRPAM